MEFESPEIAPPDFLEFFEEVTDDSKSKEEVTAAYDKWSNYEEMIKKYSPEEPLVGAQAFQAQYGNKGKDIKILDAGAGTGLAAEELVKLGFINIDALEPCETLAKQALEKNIYKKWYKAYMCKDRLPIDDNVYDVVYAVGVFGRSHAKEDCLEELVRILKPGGQIMIVMDEACLEMPYMANFEPRIRELDNANHLVYRKRLLIPNYMFNGYGKITGVVQILEKPYE